MIRKTERKEEELLREEMTMTPMNLQRRKKMTAARVQKKAVKKAEAKNQDQVNQKAQVKPQ